MDVRTINEIFYTVIDGNAERVMLFKRDVKWIPIAAHALYRDVLGVARTLESWGIGRGDRVAILSENRPEWAVADFATLLLGVVNVPVYPTLIAEQIKALLNDSGARAIFVSTHEQLRKVLAIKNETKLEKIVAMDYVGTPDAIPMQRLMHNGPLQRDPDFDARALALGPDTVATIIYTSGTTGTPKGAMLTQANLAANLVDSVELYEYQPGLVTVSFLPLSHITARHVDYGNFWHGITIAYCPFLENLLSALAEVKPHSFVAVPRVYEKIYERVQQQIGSGLKRKLYNWAIGVGRAHMDETVAGKIPTALSWKLANALVFSKVKQALGGRADLFISGGAPLNRDLIDWYNAIGIRIFEGYGLTETSPVIALNLPDAYRPGSVGKPLPNVEVRIAEDGEILVRGPSIFKGYWNLAQETAAALEDGWFHTGDVGRLDEDGYLYITDRKKDLIKTSGGKFIAPQPLENRLKTNLAIAEAAIIGERRKFPCVIIAPHFPVLEEWARQHGVQWTSPQQLIADPRVRDFYQRIVDELNQGLAQFEKIKKVLLVPGEFSIADGSLTPTLKLRRRVVEERYREQLDDLYKETEGQTLR